MMGRKKRVMFVVPSMTDGGSQRVISIIVKYLSREKYDIVLVLLKKKGEHLDKIPNDITVIDLNVERVRYSPFKLISIIKKIRPDIVFSTLGYLNLLISFIKPFLSRKIKFIARESNILSVINKDEKYPILFDLLYKLFYNNFDVIISQSESMRSDLIDNYKIKKDKIIVINNPVDTKYIKSLLEGGAGVPLFDETKVNLLAVGRLERQKGYDLLLHVISKLQEKYHLTIMGEGEEEKNLLQLAKKLQLEQRVHFLGFQANPYKYMKQADLFVLSSRYEGLPNVVLEANACGTPVIAYDCPGGTGEIIEDGINGFKVPCAREEELVKCIERAYDFKFNRKLIMDLTEKRYSVKKIIHSYSEVLDVKK